LPRRGHVRFGHGIILTLIVARHGIPPPANLSGLSREELEARFVELLGDVS
jgi:hypothetical protein